jgi:hypothetical protein
MRRRGLILLLAGLLVGLSMSPRAEAFGGRKRGGYAYSYSSAGGRWVGVGYGGYSYAPAYRGYSYAPAYRGYSYAPAYSSGGYGGAGCSTCGGTASYGGYVAPRNVGYYGGMHY